MITKKEIEQIVSKGIDDMIQKINEESGIEITDLYYGDEEDLLEIQDNLTSHLFRIYSR